MLGALRGRAALGTALIGDVIWGVVAPVGKQRCNLARIAALQAVSAETVAGVQLNRFCALGLEAVRLAAGRLKAGEADVAGGIESMSRVPIFSEGGTCYSDPITSWEAWHIAQATGAALRVRTH